jgi:hypothetical protein
VKHEEWKLRAALVVGAVLSIPVVQGALQDSISLTTAAVRVAMALVLAYVSVLVVTSVIGGYFTEPKPEPDPAELTAVDGVEDAVLVQDEQAVETEP